MDEIDEIAEFMRRYIEATQPDPQLRGIWLLMLDLEVERVRREMPRRTIGPSSVGARNYF